MSGVICKMQGQAKFKVCWCCVVVVPLFMCVCGSRGAGGLTEPDWARDLWEGPVEEDRQEGRGTRPDTRRCQAAQTSQLFRDSTGH